MPTRAAPRSAKRSAIAFPIPREPPVTNTVAPSNSSWRLWLLPVGRPVISDGRTQSSYVLKAAPSRRCLGLGSERLVGGRGARNRLPAGPCSRLARPFLGLGGGVTEPVEELGLLLGVRAHGMVGREVFDELEDARS